MCFSKTPHAFVPTKDCWKGLPSSALPVFWHEVLRDDCLGSLKPFKVQLKWHQYCQHIRYKHVKFAKMLYGVCFMLLLSINAPVEAAQSNVAFRCVAPQSIGALRFPSRHLINQSWEVKMCCQHMCSLPLRLLQRSPAFKHLCLRGAEGEECAMVI